MSEFIKAAVIGHPIAHSKSPLIHNFWIEQYGLSGSYEAIDLTPENLESGIRALINEGYSGFNLTLPHKEAALGLCDEIDSAAEAIGAVNTIAVEGGCIKGFNTDAFGFTENIRTAYPNFNFTAGPAIVLGAGGAARAILYALGQAGTPEIILLNRTKNRAEELAANIKTSAQIKVIDWKQRSKILGRANLLVNATSLGMAGKAPLEIDLSALPSKALVNDIVYAPLETDLLKQAAMQDNQTVTGIGMLLHQARPAFKEWFGILPDVTDELERRVLA